MAKVKYTDHIMITFTEVIPSASFIDRVIAAGEQFAFLDGDEHGPFSRSKKEKAQYRLFFFTRDPIGFAAAVLPVLHTLKATHEYHVPWRLDISAY